MNDPTALGISVPGNESAATPDTRIRRFCAAEITAVQRLRADYHRLLHDFDAALIGLINRRYVFCEETSSGVISISEVHV